jgi:hypothetical protein
MVAGALISQIRVTPIEAELISSKASDLVVILPKWLASIDAKLENWMEAHTSGFIAILYLSKNI